MHSGLAFVSPRPDSIMMIEDLGTHSIPGLTSGDLRRCFKMITKHGPHYWLDIRVNNRRIRRSLKTGERALAIERARDIARELREEHARKDIRISDFSAKYLEWAWSSKPASADREQQRMKICIRPRHPEPDSAGPPAPDSPSGSEAARNPVPLPPTPALLRNYAPRARGGHLDDRGDPGA